MTSKRIRLISLGRNIANGYGLGFLVWILLFPVQIVPLTMNRMDPGSVMKLVVLIGLFIGLSTILRLSLRWSFTGLLPFLFSRVLFREYFAIAIIALLILVVQTVKNPDWLQRQVNAARALRLFKDRRIGLWALVLLCTAVSVELTWGLIRLHHRFETTAFDLAVFESVFWNSVNGHPFASPMELGGSHLGLHFSPGLASVFWIYRLIPRTETLFAIESFAMAFAAVPLFLYGERVLGSWRLAWLVAIAYLLHPATSAPVYYDFHEVKLLPLAMFTAFYFMSRGWTWASFLFFVLSATIKEDVALALIPMGLAIALSPREKKIGIAILIFGGIYFMIAKFMVMPYFAGGVMAGLNYVSELINPNLGGDVKSILATLLLNPAFTLSKMFEKDKLIFLIQMFFPVLFVPFFSLRTSLLVAVPVAMAALSHLLALHLISVQAAIAFLVPSFVSFIWFLRAVSTADTDHPGGFRSFFSRLNMPTGKSRAAVFALAALFVTAIWQVNLGVLIFPEGAPFKFGGQLSLKMNDALAEKYERVASVLQEIPASATVTASETLCPHVARRRTILTYRYADRETDYFALWNGDHDSARFDPIVRSSGRYRPIYSDRDITVFRRTN